MICPECKEGSLRDLDAHFAECDRCGAVFSVQGVGREEDGAVDEVKQAIDNYIRARWAFDDALYRGLYAQLPDLARELLAAARCDRPLEAKP